MPCPGPVPPDPTGGSKRHPPSRPATSFGLLPVEATLDRVVDLDFLAPDVLLDDLGLLDDVLADARTGA
jgi:hypothetical protein